jgi:hypothetical protein
VNSNSQFTVSARGTTTIGQVGQTNNAAGLQIGYGGLCVDSDGTCVASTTGRISAREYTTGATDLAENYYSEDLLEQGDIVAPTGLYTVARAASTSRTVLGIISTRPGIILGEDDRPQMDIPSYPVALSGRVPLKVSTLQGPIKVGDRIVLSTTTPGVGVAEATSTERGRLVVGIALEDFDGSFYRSKGVRDTETREVATGTPVCTTETVVHSSRNGGGFDVEGEKGSNYENSSTEEVTTCTQERVLVVPEAGNAIATTTDDGREMKIGKILVFVAGGQSLGTIGEGIAWEDDGENLAFFRALDLHGNNIFNVGRIAAGNGLWSIDADGTIRAERVVAKDVAAERSLEVGTAAMPTGVTIYDTTTGEPYCLKVSMGAVQAVPGTCSGSTSGFGSSGPSGGSGDTGGGAASGGDSTGEVAGG